MRVSLGLGAHVSPHSGTQPCLLPEHPQQLPQKQPPPLLPPPPPLAAATVAAAASAAAHCLLLLFPLLLLPPSVSAPPPVPSSFTPVAVAESRILGEQLPFSRATKRLEQVCAGALCCGLLEHPWLLEPLGGAEA